MCAPLRAVGSDSSGGSGTVRSSWHAAERPPQLGFAVVCTSAAAGPGPHGGLCSAQHQQSPAPVVPSRCALPAHGDVPCAVAAARSGARPGALAALTLSQALPLQGLPLKAAGTEMLCFPAPLIGAAVWASHRALPGARGCRLGRITPLRSHTPRGFAAGPHWAAQ